MPSYVVVSSGIRIGAGDTDLLTAGREWIARKLVGGSTAESQWDDRAKIIVMGYTSDNTTVRELFQSGNAAEGYPRQATRTDPRVEWAWTLPGQTYSWTPSHFIVRCPAGTGEVDVCQVNMADLSSGIGNVDSGRSVSVAWHCGVSLPQRNPELRELNSAHAADAEPLIHEQMKLSNLIMHPSLPAARNARLEIWCVPTANIGQIQVGAETTDYVRKAKLGHVLTASDCTIDGTRLTWTFHVPAVTPGLPAISRRWFWRLSMRGEEMLLARGDWGVRPPSAPAEDIDVTVTIRS